MSKKVLGIPVVMAGLLISGIVFAQVGNGVQAPKQIEITQKLKAINRCEIITKNVEKRITNFDRNKVTQVERFRKSQNRIISLVAKLEANGLDVAQIKIDLVELDAKINKFAADYDTYLADLRDTKAYTCDRSEGEFKAKLQIARAQLKIVHDDAVAIKTFWAKTIKPQIELLKIRVETTTEPGGTN